MAKKHGGGHHGGAWKVAYADFITAMMAFFLVMWITGLNPNSKKAIEDFFKTPLSSTADLLFFNGFKPKTYPVPFNVAWPNVTNPISMPKPRPLKDAKNIAALKTELKNMPGYSTNVRMSINEEEIRIDLVDNQQASLFGTLNERFTPHVKQMLTHLAGIIREMPNRLAIEGHTNSVPYQGPSGESNWELSTERANMARILLEQNGVPKGQIMEIRGCADQNLIEKLDPLSLLNRHISVIVKRKVPFYGDSNDVFGE